jgi:hypothetical protein
LARYSVKFFVVPDSSERFTGVMARSGRPELPSAAIAGSFHLVILPSKIFATVAGESFSSGTSSSL